VTNPQIQAVNGVYLFRSGRNEEAERKLSEALALDRNFWTAHYGLTQLYVETVQKHLPVEHAKRLQALVEPEECGADGRKASMREFA
jgi:hypothetical protein